MEKMDEELMQNSICVGLPSKILERKDFQNALKDYLEDETAICEKTDTNISFSFPFHKRFYTQSSGRGKLEKNPLYFAFWTIEGLPGIFVFKTASHICKERKMFRSDLLGMYIPESKDEIAYVIRTELSREKSGFFLQVGIGNMPMKCVNSISNVYSYSNITIFEKSFRSFQDVSIDDTRLESIPNPIRKLALQELSSKTKSMMEFLQKDKTFALIYRPK